MANKLNLNKKYIIVGIIVLVIIIIAICYVRDRIIFDDKESEDFSEYYAAETIRPRNLGELYGYNGSNELNDLYMSMKTFVSYIAKLKVKVEGIEAEELKQFFSINETEVIAYTGISDEETFVEFVEYIRQYIVEDEFKYAEVVSDSSYKKNNYYWVEMKFYYGDNNEEVKFHVGLAMKTNNKKLVKYSIKSMDNTQEIYERNQNLINEIKANDNPGGNAEF